MAITPPDDGHPSSAPVEPGEVDPPVSGVPSDNTTLVDILDAFEREGYQASFRAGEDGRLTCSACGNTSSPESFDAQVQRRLEGASDPADEMLVLGGACGSCRARGTLVLGFGPTASAADGAVLERLSI